MELKPSALRIAFWNAAGLSNQRNELSVFARQNELDVILISETHLIEADPDVKILGYKFYRTDRNIGPNQRRAGGTAIYVRSFFTHHLLSQLPLVSIETTSISIETTEGPLFIFSCYHRPRTNIWYQDLETVLLSGHTVIAAGDFNAQHRDWNCVRSNTSGRTITTFLERYPDCSVSAPPQPTCFVSSSNPSTIDFAIVRNNPFVTQTVAINDLSSDHNPVIMQLGNLNRRLNPPLQRSINFSKFHDHLQSNYGPLPNIKTPNEMEEAVSNFTAKFQEAIDYASFERPFPQQPPIPMEIVDLIAEKNRARRISRRTRHPIDKATTNRLSHEVKYALRNFRNSQWEQTLQSLTTEDNSLWRMSKALRSTTQFFPPIHGPDGVAYAEQEKAEAFARCLQNQCTVNLQNADIDHLEMVTEFVEELKENAPDADEQTLDFVTPNEVVTLLGQLQKRKASGPDKISNTLLKILPKKPIIALVGIYNAMLRYQSFPSAWKKADVIFLPKPNKDPTFPQNYRPISLLSAVGKIGERLILSRLSRYVEELALLPNEQFGFRPNHSTTLQVLRVTELATQNLNSKTYTGMISLDIAKAFDTVWHDGLIYKLCRYGIPAKLVRLISSFLSNRSFRSRIGNSNSTLYALEAGVPQGSVLSPTLYSLYTADIPRPTDRRIQLAIYADDTAVLVSSKSINTLCLLVQEYLTQLENFFCKWCIQANAEKSSALIFTRRPLPVERLPVLTLSDNPIPWRQETKYLGVTFDKSLTFKSHIKNVSTRGRQVMAQLFPLLRRKSTLSVKNKLTIFKLIIRPTMLYASLAWGHAAKSHIKHLQVTQNKALRLVLDAPWYVTNAVTHQDTNTPLIKDYLLSFATKQFAELAQHPNPLMRQAVDYDPHVRMKFRRPKVVLLD